jgi:hypothetical protein
VQYPQINSLCLFLFQVFFLATFTLFISLTKISKVHS